MKQLNNLRWLKLGENKITFVAWESLPKMVKTIDLSNNLLTKVGSIKHLKKISKLNLECNKITSVIWKLLPKCLHKLDLSHNLLKSVSSMKHLTELEYLYLQYNKFSYMSKKFLEVPALEELHLCNNRISKIGDLNDGYFSYLDLSNNKFNFNKGNLIKHLWENIPNTYKLILNGNNLVELPCQLKEKIKELKVMDCNLIYICPQIYSNEKIRINLANNTQLKMSFMPNILYPFPLPVSRVPHENNYSRITSNMKILPNTKKFTKGENKFKNASLNLNENFFCKCCARCEESGNNTKLIEKTMVMDCFFYDYEKMNYKSDDDDGKWSYEKERQKKALYTSLPGQWKTTVKTRLCDKCKKIIEENEKINQNSDSIVKQNVGEKIPRLEKTNEQFCNLQTVVAMEIDIERAEQDHLPHSFHEQPLLNINQQQRYNILPPISSIYPSENAASTFNSAHNYVENIELLDLHGNRVLTVPANSIQHLQNYNNSAIPPEFHVSHSSSVFEDGININTYETHSGNHPPQQCLIQQNQINIVFNSMPQQITNIDNANTDDPNYPVDQALPEYSNNRTLYTPYSNDNDIDRL